MVQMKKQNKDFNIWYKKNKNKCIQSFGDFIKKYKIGDMDLNVYCRYQYFLYLHKDKLEKDYYTKSVDGEKPCDRIPSLEFFMMACFSVQEELETTHAEA